MTIDYKDIVKGLIEEEQETIGALAVKKAEEVEGLELDDDGKVTEISGNGKQVLSELVDNYESMVGESIGSVIRHQGDKEEMPDLPENVQKYFH
ncbi:MAG: hypothetical protein ABEJ69_02940 [Candidatus Nanohaloarchaea archaeon]